MKQITVRGIAPELEKRIRREAKATGKSLNKVMLELIAGSAEPAKRRKKPAGASLAELAGGWSGREAREFEESLRVFEEIDEATWKGSSFSTRARTRGFARESLRWSKRSPAPTPF